MPYLLLGLAALVLFLILGQRFIKANPAALARQARKFGGVLVLIAAVALSVTGKFALALPLAILGLGMLQRGLFAGFSFPGSARKSPGQTSQVRTEFLEMTLDHDSGAMIGRILKGGHRHKSLADLPLAELLALRRAWLVEDEQSAQLIEAYLDYVHPGWHAKAGSDSYSGQHSEAPPGPGGGRMTVDEAYEVLGLAPGASAADVRKAHRELMKKLHPDHGGSTYLAAKINQAKDVLLEITR